MSTPRLALATLLALAAAAAAAQGLYRWTDEKGRVHITDTPPPGSAKGVQKTRPAPAGAPAEQLPYELSLAVQDFPVTLYSFPNCEDPCTRAREALNKRGVPFKEIQVTDEASLEDLKRVSGAAEVPVLLVGRSMHKGFEQGAYDALLDAARYPKAGTVPVRAQGKPKPPPDPAAAKAAEPEKPKAEAPAPPAGPYSLKPGAEEPKVARPYAPRPGTDEPVKSGPYAPKAPAAKADSK